jgi:hypothetical protein
MEGRKTDTNCGLTAIKAIFSFGLHTKENRAGYSCPIYL